MGWLIFLVGMLGWVKFVTAGGQMAVSDGLQRQRKCNEIPRAAPFSKAQARPRWIFLMPRGSTGRLGNRGENGNLGSLHADLA
ncbi:hypothetical protein LY76DRAFT_431676 [Colletotrichum caudatum]|nr:hypothetical protein LY76DRAFT_431676 [Colletotrichum caudatum]